MVKDCFLPKTRNKTRMPALTTSTQHSPGGARAIMQEKEMKDVQIGNKKVKLCLFVDNVILYIESPKECIKTIRTV